MVPLQIHTIQIAQIDRLIIPSGKPTTHITRKEGGPEVRDDRPHPRDPR